jgi:hypothetical protein
MKVKLPHSFIPTVFPFIWLFVHVYMPLVPHTLLGKALQGGKGGGGLFTSHLDVFVLHFEIDDEESFFVGV